MELRGSVAGSIALVMLSCSWIAAPLRAERAVADTAARNRTASSCTAPVTPHGATLVLRIDNPAAMRSDVRRVMAEESSAIWKRQELTLRWVEGAPTDSGDESPIGAEAAGGDVSTLDVTFAADVPPRLLASAHPSLAAIEFTDGVPAKRIAVFPSQAERLLAEVRSDDRPLKERPVAIHSLLLGRLLGRALAHEIGHYLFRSAQHTDAGLMRAVIRTDQLIMPSLRPFRVVAPDAAPCEMLAWDSPEARDALPANRDR
jgi:hypothetical protein